MLAWPRCCHPRLTYSFGSCQKLFQIGWWSKNLSFADPVQDSELLDRGLSLCHADLWPCVVLRPIEALRSPFVLLFVTISFSIRQIRLCNKDHECVALWLNLKDGHSDAKNSNAGSSCNR